MRFRVQGMVLFAQSMGRVPWVKKLCRGAKPGRMLSESSKPEGNWACSGDWLFTFSGFLGRQCMGAWPCQYIHCIAMLYVHIGSPSCIAVMTILALYATPPSCIPWHIYNAVICKASIHPLLNRDLPCVQNIDGIILKKFMDKRNGNVYKFRVQFTCCQW